MPLRRLSRAEYQRTVRDLFGPLSENPVRLVRDLPADPPGTSGFATPVAASLFHVEAYLTSAESLATEAVQNIDDWLPCHAAGADEVCAREFITTFGRRAFRRPVTDEEIGELLELFASTADELALADFASRIRVVMIAMLQSPRFLYHWQLGEDVAESVDGLVALNEWELASRLSYFAWGSMPDDELLDAAESGALATATGLEASMARLLADPRARQGLGEFASQWMQLGELEHEERDPALFPEWTDETGSTMDRQVREFFTYVALDSEGTLHDLLTSVQVPVNGTLARLYDLEEISGEEFRVVDLDADRRAGLFTLVGVMTAHSGPNQPIYRGKLVRDRVLCDEVPPVPQDVDPSLPDIGPDATRREQLEKHSTDPVCASCHRLMDPIGFAFEHYDTLGVWQAEERPGLPVDATAEIPLLDGGETAMVDGAVELAEVLSSQDKVRRCFARQLYRIAIGRRDEPVDASSIDRVTAVGGDGWPTILDLYAAIVASDGFRFRVPSEGEVTL